jgi:acyl-CoA thioesterase-1
MRTIYAASLERELMGIEEMSQKSEGIAGSTVRAVERPRMACRLGTVLLAGLALACGDNQPSTAEASGMAGEATSRAGSSSMGGTGGATTSAGASGGAEATAGSSDGGGSPATSSGPMRLISRGVPAFASSGTATNANDDKPNIAWSADALPAWLAYDLSGVAAAQRRQALVAWYCYWSDYMAPMPTAQQQLPLDYVIELNSAAGGGAPPTTGWVEVENVAANARSARQHLVDLATANWLRMTVTRASDPGKVMVDLDVYSAPGGANDAWLFMGDSITYMTTQRAFSDLPALVTKIAAERVPLVVDAALGGTNTTTAQAIIADSMAEFPGRFVVLAYGTNDHANEFQMEALVQKVIAAGKTPVVPRMPWSDQKLSEGPLINQSIAALYVKYPEILQGPDLWAVFENQLELIPHGDVHPNSDGQEVLRQAWAQTLAAASP